ncbi:MAG TPA: YtxH domain-containing protein [Chryseosolibacter sp.]
MTNGKAVVAVLAGVAAGAVLGMLFAPDKGRDTRKKVSRKGEELADALNEKIEQKFDELLNSVTGKVKTAVEQNGSPGKKPEPVN